MDGLVLRRLDDIVAVSPGSRDGFLSMEEMDTDDVERLWKFLRRDSVL